MEVELTDPKDLCGVSQDPQDYTTAVLGMSS